MLSFRRKVVFSFRNLRVTRYVGKSPGAGKFRAKLHGETIVIISETRSNRFISSKTGAQKKPQECIPVAPLLLAEIATRIHHRINRSDVISFSKYKDKAVAQGAII